MSKPYRIWTLDAPFDKAGTPRMGSFGVRTGRVVVFESETFKRMVSEHPSLATAEFTVGAYDDAETT
jgi:hypothetical protein